MSKNGYIVITGLGAVTPVGLSVQPACAALRAGITRMKELKTYWPDRTFSDKKPAVGGRVPTERFDGEPKPEEWPGHESFNLAEPPASDSLVAPDGRRIVELMMPALREALADAAVSDSGRLPAKIGLYVGLDTYEKTEPIIETIQQTFGTLFAPIIVKAEGRAAGLTALYDAAQDLAAGKISGAVVGGVDSLIRGPVLAWLDTNGILKSDHNSEGVIPGEAAAFIFMEFERSATERGAKVHSKMLATGCDIEPTAETEEPNQAQGLTNLLHQVRKASGDLKAPPLVVCDLNGDRYRAIEWAFAFLRTLGNLHGDTEVWHTADCIGDCGAASGILHMIWASVAFRKKYAPSDRALVWGASDGTTRAAVMLAPA